LLLWLFAKTIEAAKKDMSAKREGFVTNLVPVICLEEEDGVHAIALIRLDLSGQIFP